MGTKTRPSDNPEWMELFNKRFFEAKQIAKTIESVEVIETDKGWIIQTTYYNGKIQKRKFDRI